MADQVRAVDNTVLGQWANPNNAFVLDDSCTSVASNALANVYNFTGTPFTIPGDATILGIEVKTYRAVSDDNDAYTIELQDTGPVWRLKTGTNLQAVCADALAETLGGAADTWGGNFTPAHINGANFQVRLKTFRTGKAGTVYVDYIEVKVYYEIIIPEEAGGLRMTLSLRGHEGFDCKTRGGKARRRVF